MSVSYPALQATALSLSAEGQEPLTGKDALHKESGLVASMSPQSPGGHTLVPS